MVLSEGTTVHQSCLPRSKYFRSVSLAVTALFVALIVSSCNLINSNAAKEVELETLPFYNTADFDAEWIEKDNPGYADIHTVEDFSFVNQVGQVITNDSLKGSIYVANFFFTTCPNICPKMTNNLQALQKTFAQNNQIKLVSFSVMPWVDSVAKLNEYGKRKNINPTKWFLLTGDKEQIYRLGRKSFFAEKGLGLQKDDTEFLHTESMLLVDRKGRIRGIYNATQLPDIDRVTEDIGILLHEL